MEGAPSGAAAPQGASGDQPLVSPEQVRRALPATPAVDANVRARREELRALLHGRDARRLLAIVGPCSIHDAEGGLAYARRLAPLAARVSPRLLVLMRVFVEKPRTHVGWKGLVSDPTLDGRCDVGLGLATSRRLLLQINELGLGCATELLDPLVAPYLRDLVAWGGIGARTHESPVHRQLASDAPHPIGFKNGTDGEVEGAIHALRAAASPHTFPALADDGRLVLRQSAGNPDVHVVLRGGRRGTNHDRVSLAHAAKRATALGAVRPVLVDCSHANSGKDPARQPGVAREVLASWRRGAPGLLGVMLESHLEGGRQEPAAGERLRPGRSITDACLGWEETEALLEEIAAAVAEAP